jgi:hypothetical protein
VAGAVGNGGLAVQTGTNRCVWLRQRHVDKHP